tara:strand:- start:1033 stop:1656 length:624 start_codon:yes stop_codon:yes gene_type:complete
MKQTLKVLPIKPSETYNWYLKKHYAKRIPQILYAFGLYKKNILIGVISYGKPPSPHLCEGVCGKQNSEYVLELNRLCLLENKKNFASFLISHSLKLLPKPKIIVSFSDTAMNHTGYVYQASNFFYTGATVERTDVDTGSKHARHCKNLDASKRKFRSSKHRYIFFSGNKKQKKFFLNCLNYPIHPYPKNDNKNYDATAKIETQLILF